MKIRPTVSWLTLGHRRTDGRDLHLRLTLGHRRTDGRDLHLRLILGHRRTDGRDLHLRHSFLLCKERLMSWEMYVSRDNSHVPSTPSHRDC